MDTSFIAAAGEHFVLAQLLRRNMLASLAPRNAKDVDILVLNTNEAIVASVQVKARQTGADGGWPMRPRHADLVRPHLFYALVDFEPVTAVTYIVPSCTVADVLTRSHSEWMKLTSPNGHPHQDTDLRRLVPRFKGFTVPGYPDGWLVCYREQWETLRQG